MKKRPFFIENAPLFCQNRQTHLCLPIFHFLNTHFFWMK